MARRGENIRKRKDGRWEGRYICGRDEKGEAVYKSVYGKQYNDVRLKLLEAKKMEEKRAVSVDITFSEVLEKWMAANKIRLKGATEYKYRYMIETHILPWCRDIKMSQLSTKVVNEFLDNKLRNGRLDGAGGLAASYVRSMQLIIKSAICYAVEEELCLPIGASVTAPQAIPKELSIFNKKEQAKLETYIWRNLNYSNLGILISLYTGLRIGEVCALTWNDVNLEEQLLYVRSTIARIQSEKRKSMYIIDRPKTRSSLRTVPISSKLMPALEEMYSEQKTNYILSNDFMFLNPRTYEYRYHRILKNCGVADINYHGLRHTFATRCIEAGVDVKSLSEILGHANVNITLNTYVHSSMELKRIQLEKLVVS